jgi:hypothetical protein
MDPPLPATPFSLLLLLLLLLLPRPAAGGCFGAAMLL